MGTASQGQTLQFDVVKRVTLPFLVLEGDTPYYVKFDSAIMADNSQFSDRVRKSRKDGDQLSSQEPMHLANVTNLQTGEIARLVAHSVLESNLAEAYPNDGYVGKTFQITKSKTKSGRGARQYFTFNIVEIQLKSSSVQAQHITKK